MATAQPKRTLKSSKKETAKSSVKKVTKSSKRVTAKSGVKKVTKSSEKEIATKTRRIEPKELDNMSDKERNYHKANVTVIPIAVLSGIVLGITVAISDSSYNSPSPIVAVLMVLCMIVSGAGAIWVVISGLINENVRTMVIKGVKGVFKSFMGLFAATGWAVCLLAPFEMVAAFFIILIIFSVIAFLWEVAYVVLVIYLYTSSSKALKTNTSTFF